MDASALSQRIATSFDGLDIETAPNGDVFFFYDPDKAMDPARRLPFATIVFGDDYDTVSNLSREGVYRLNIGPSKETYRAFFGEPPRFSPDGAIPEGHAALDQLIPHPTYGYLGWVAILNPSEETYAAKVEPLLREAHEIAKNRYLRRTTN